ncbi:MAG TPA: hypothetical protein VF590_15330, partial [Isosphaeraceae bacterium]
YQDFVCRNLISGLGILLRIGLMFAWLPSSPTIVTLAVAQSCITVFEVVIAWLLARRRYPTLQFSLGHFDRSLLRRILA